MGDDKEMDMIGHDFLSVQDKSFDTHPLVLIQCPCLNIS